jgi:alpha-tubulin suppressor-like RCC1 family protein
VVTEDNKIFFKGESKAFVFAENMSQPSLKLNPAFTQKDSSAITAMAVGNNAAIFITEANKLWVLGNDFL